MLESAMLAYETREREALWFAGEPGKRTWETECWLRSKFQVTYVNLINRKLLEDLLSGNRSLRRRLMVGRICGSSGKGQWRIKNYAL